jgi:hypothetical protein
MAKQGNRRQRGYTLLEYCAGAAIVAGVLWSSLNTMGTNISGLIGSVGNWAKARGTFIDNANR